MKPLGAIKPNFKPESNNQDNQRKSKALLIMLSMDRREASPELATAYHIASRDYRIETVEQAARDFITGKVDDVNKAFCPTPAQFAAQCRKIQIPEDAFNRIWHPTKAQQLESREAQHRREMIVEKAKTPEQKLESINRIRKEQGLDPFNPYRAAKHYTNAKPDLPEMEKSNV